MHIDEDRAEIIRGVRFYGMLLFLFLGLLLVVAFFLGMPTILLVLLALATTIVIVAMISPLVAHGIAPFLIDWMFKTGKDTGSPVQYGIPATMVVKGDYEGAIANYHEILMEYPNEFRAYIEIMKVVATHLKDEARLQSYYQMAQEAFSEDEEALRQIKAARQIIEEERKNIQKASEEFEMELEIDDQIEE